MIKVVFLDDEELVIEVFKSSIAWGKYDMEVVRTFLNPYEAYDYLMQNDVDIVFTDIKMPVMNGDVFIEKVGAVKPYIHFVAVSAYDDYLSVKNAFKYGALDYILKINVDSDEMDILLKKLQLICKERNLKSVDTNIKHILHKMKGTTNPEQKLTMNCNVYKSMDIIELITCYIHTHYRERFSLEDISVKFAISPSHLSRSFHKKTGIHFIEYVNQVKINKAKQLLIISNMIISEIFEEIGYDNLEHFSRVFKKYVGVSPSKYRTENGYLKWAPPQ